MKNYMKEIEKAAKYIAKEEKLFIQRDEETVYISNAHYLIKTDLSTYNAIFRLSHPRFVELSDNGTYSANSKKQLPEKIPHGMDFRKCIMPATDAGPATVTPYKMELSDNRPDLRIIFVNGEQVRVNNEYFEKLQIFGVGQLYGSNRKRPVFTDFDENSAFMVLPVNYCSSEAERFEVIDTETAAKTNAA